MCKRGQKKPYGPTTKAYSLACQNFKKICLQIGHMIYYLLTKLGRAGWENIWLKVMAYGPSAAKSVRHDFEPNIFPSSPPTSSISTYTFSMCHYRTFTPGQRAVNVKLGSPERWLKLNFTFLT